MGTPWEAWLGCASLHVPGESTVSRHSRSDRPQFFLFSFQISIWKEKRNSSLLSDPSSSFVSFRQRAYRPTSQEQLRRLFKFIIQISSSGRRLQMESWQYENAWKWNIYFSTQIRIWKKNTHGHVKLNGNIKLSEGEWKQMESQNIIFRFPPYANINCRTDIDWAAIKNLPDTSFCKWTRWKLVGRIQKIASRLRPLAGPGISSRWRHALTRGIVI